MWIGMVLGLAGVAVVVSGDLGNGSAQWWAYLLPLIGMLTTTGTVLTQRLRPTESLLQAITMQMVVTAVTLAAAAGYLCRPGGMPAELAWSAVLRLVAFLSTLGAKRPVPVRHLHARRDGGERAAVPHPPTTALRVACVRRADHAHGRAGDGGQRGGGDPGAALLFGRRGQATSIEFRDMNDE